MSETYPSDSTLNELSGTLDAEQEVLYIPTGQSPYYTSFYRMQSRLLDVARRAGDLRVYKDSAGALVFGVRAGKYLNGDTAVNYAGASNQSLTDNATHYIYLLANGTLTVNTSGFPVPSATPHIPLATIATGTASAGGVAGSYDFADITDYRGRAFVSVAGTQRRMSCGTVTFDSENENGYVTVAHGLGATPASVTITPTCHLWSAGGVGNWWVTTDATNITVHIDSYDLNDPITFNWIAMI
ncbi:MAG: hypothetical protein WC869_05155 [Phycisphaerae bacterium]|jgi:hypothetical protein